MRRNNLYRAACYALLACALAAAPARAAALTDAGGVATGPNAADQTLPVSDGTTDPDPAAQAVATLSVDGAEPQSFSTFDDAAAALANVSGEVTLALAQNTTFSQPIAVPKGASVTLDLNGHSLVGAPGIYDIELGIAPITVNGSLTIKDSMYDPEAEYPENALTTEGRIKVVGSLALESGCVTIDATKACEGVTVGSKDAPGGSYVQTGGYLTVKSQSDDAYVNGIMNYGSVRIEDGTVDCRVKRGYATAIANNGSLNILGGYVLASKEALTADPEVSTLVYGVRNLSDSASASITGGYIQALANRRVTMLTGYAAAIYQQGGTVSLGEDGAADSSLKVVGQVDGIKLEGGALEVGEGVLVDGGTGSYGYGISVYDGGFGRVSLSVRNAIVRAGKSALYSECTEPGACVVEGGATLASWYSAPVATGAGARASVVLKGGTYSCYASDEDVVKSSLESLRRYLADGSGDVTGYELSYVESDHGVDWQAKVEPSDSATVRPPLEVGDTALYVTLADGTEQAVTSLAEALDAVREAGGGKATVTLLQPVYESGRLVIDTNMDVTLREEGYGPTLHGVSAGEGESGTAAKDLHITVLGKLTVTGGTGNVSYEVGAPDGSAPGELLLRGALLWHEIPDASDYLVWVHKGAHCRVEKESTLKYGYGPDSSTPRAVVLLEGELELLTGSKVWAGPLDSDQDISPIVGVLQRGGSATVSGSLFFVEGVSANGADEQPIMAVVWGIYGGSLKVEEADFWCDDTVLVMSGGAVELGAGTRLSGASGNAMPRFGVAMGVPPTDSGAMLSVTGGDYEAATPLWYADGSRTNVAQVMGGTFKATDESFNLTPFLAAGYKVVPGEDGSLSVEKDPGTDPDPEPTDPEEKPDPDKPGEKGDPEEKPDPDKPGEGDEKDPGETDPGEKPGTDGEQADPGEEPDDGDQGSGDKTPGPDQGADPDQPADQDAPSKKPLVPSAGDATALLAPGLLAASGLSLVAASRRRR